MEFKETKSVDCLQFLVCVCLEVCSLVSICSSTTRVGLRVILSASQMKESDNDGSKDAMAGHQTLLRLARH